MGGDKEVDLWGGHDVRVRQTHQGKGPAGGCAAHDERGKQERGGKRK